MISEDDARRIAQDFVVATSTGFPYTYEVVSARLRKGEWSVVIAVITPEGGELDGPMVVLIDTETGEPRFFPSL
jgi:hypothetical protein